MHNPIKAFLKNRKEKREFEEIFREYESSAEYKAVPVEQLMGFGGKPEQNLRAILGKLPKTYEDTALSYLNHDGFQGSMTRVTTNAATIPIRYLNRKSYDAANADSWEDSQSPLAVALRTINPMGSPMTHMRDTLSYYMLDGNAYWDFSTPGWVWNLKPNRVDIVTDNNGLPDYLNYTIDNSVDKIDMDEVCHFKTFHPTNDHYGASPALSLALSLESDFYMKSYMRDFFKNDAMPRTILATSKVWDNNKRLRFLKQWKKRYSGTGNQRGVGLIENNEVTVHKLGDTMKDSDFQKGRISNSQSIKSSVGTPSAIMAEDTANYATAKQQVEIFTLMVVLPLVSIVLDQFNAWDQAESQNVIAVPDLWRHPLARQVLLARMKDASSLTKDGLATINEVRSWYFLGPLSWGDEWHRPANLYGPDAGSETKIAAPVAKQIKADGDEDRFEYRRKLEKKFEKRATKWINKWIRKFRPEYIRQRDYALANIEAILETLDLKALKELLQAVEKAILDDDLKAYTGATEKASGDVDAILRAIFNLQGEIDIFADIGEKLIGDVSEDFAEEALFEAGGEIFDQQDPNLLTFTETQKLNFATQVSSTTESELRSMLTKKLSEGASIDEITSGIKDIFDDVDTTRAWRARTIARTQVQGAANHAQGVGYKQAGAKKKEWVTAGDEDVRSSHAAIDGEQQDIDGYFSNGLKHPGDPSGSAGETINCRCSLAPVILGKDGEIL